MTRLPTLTSFIQHCIGSPIHSDYTRKIIIKEIQIGKEEVKLSLFAVEMILSTGKPKTATIKLVELINEFGNFAGYKNNIQKSVAFLYTINEISGR